MPAIKVERCTLPGFTPKSLRQELAEMNCNLGIVRFYVERMMAATGLSVGEVWTAMLKDEAHGAPHGSP